MKLKDIYEQNDALLKGHFLLSSGKHSEYYLQSAKILENPKISEKLAIMLADEINKNNIKVNTVCSPAIGGLLAGYELARALNVRFIFTERVNGNMTLRRGFEVSSADKIIICEDIITTGGSALECADEIKKYGANIVAYASLANRGFCKRYNSNTQKHTICKLDDSTPLFSLDDFIFDVYDENDCPMCKSGSNPYKPGSRS